MSGDVTTLDPSEIEKFKQRFAAGRAKEIEDAYALAFETAKKVSDKEEQLVDLKNDENDKYQKWNTKKTVRLKKRKPGDPTKPEKDAEDAYNLAKQTRETAEEELETLQEQRDEALKKAKLLPREAYEEKVKALIARLKGTEKKLEDVDNTAIADIKGRLNKRDYDGVDARIGVLENNVLAAVAYRDLPAKFDALSARLATLQEAQVKDPAALKNVAAELKSIDREAPTGEALAKLERKIAPELTALEQRVQTILDLFWPLDGEIALLERAKVPDARAHRAELVKCGNVAKQNPEKAQARLLELRKAVQKTQEIQQLEADAEKEFPGELASLKQRLKDFTKLSPSHAGYSPGISLQSKQCDRAVEFAAEKEFTAARDVLSAVNNKLDEWHEAANNKEQEKIDKLQALEAKKAKEALELAAAEARAAEEEALRQAEEEARANREAAMAAMTAASLDVIGKGIDFNAWMDKVQTLKTANLLALGIGGPYWLPGNTTVQLEINIAGTTEQDFADEFVVHYHPIWDGIGSAVHAKPYCGNMDTPKDRRLNKDGHWLYGAGIPSLGAIQADFLR